MRTSSLFLLACLIPAWGQVQPLKQREEAFAFDSGTLINHTERRAVVFQEWFFVEGATWLRMFFSEAVLGETPEGGQPTVLKITSLKDGYSQFLDGVSLRQWRHSSAYFNGDAVELEIIADPGAAPSLLRMSTIMVGLPGHNAPESICGPTDDRELSDDARAARISPVGCSGWLIDDQNRCFITAGHCVGDTLDIIEFNVPLSNSNGSTNHPHPDDQYPIDQASLQFDVTVIGNDWAYFGTFPNSNTGLTPFEAQQETYILGQPPATPNNETINITGYGTTDGTQGTPLEWNQVQKVHTGPLVTVSGTVLQYAVDTTGGNSGSAILNEDTGEAIGIHTNAGCNVAGGANNGTSTANAGLQNALANPAGVCALGPPPLAISFPGGLPELLSPEGTTIQVQIDEINGGMLDAGTAKMFYDNGMGDVEVMLQAAEGGNLFEAVFPALDCLTDATFYFSAVSTGGRTIVEPFYAPAQRFYRNVATDYDQAFRDDFETDMGWTVENDGGLADGAWERGRPGGYGLRADPGWDVEGSGRCFVTDNNAGNSDVDGGHTILVSPTLDASNGDPYITYWRWWSDEGSTTFDDTFLVQVSDDDGANWTTLEEIGPNLVGSWVFRSFRIADFVTPNDQFRIRFDAYDLGAGSIIEAGVDSVAIYNDMDGFSCALPCPFDLSGDAVIDETDQMQAVGFWGDPGNPFDFNEDGDSDVLDILLLMGAFGACP